MINQKGKRGNLVKFYDVMQLDAANTKQLLSGTEDKKTKRRYYSAFVIKNILCVMFCLFVVVGNVVLFGSENSTAGVVILLAIMSMRQSDLDIRPAQGAAVIIALFGILATFPHFAANLSPLLAALCNLCVITLLVILSCHNIYMFNHTTFVLGYILLMGYDVSGEVLGKRVVALMIGGILVAVIYYIKHRKDTVECGICNLFKDFLVFNERTQWQIKMAVGVTTGMLIGSLVGIPRVMWIGFSCMTILSPLHDKVPQRSIQRIAGTVAGCMLFVILYNFMPGDPLVYLGVLGGFCAGFSGTYKWRTVFNCIGSLVMAVGTMGLPIAVLCRVVNNVIGVIYSFCFHKCWNGAHTLLLRQSYEVENLEL